MICCITYGDEKFENAKELNVWSAYNKGGADKAIAYGPEDLDEQFKIENAQILSFSRGGGYWLWKPYIILKTMKTLNQGDYVCYTDAGAVYIDKVQFLIDSMGEQDIMCFQIRMLEKYYTKRDAFILMDCDDPKYSETKQRWGGYCILKVNDVTVAFVEKWLNYCKDIRIITDRANVLGKENYEGFVENRHDQTVFSLLTKKHNILPFRDPSQFGNVTEAYDEDVIERSIYPQIIYSHRNGKLKTWDEYKKFVNNIEKRKSSPIRTFIYKKIYRKMINIKKNLKRKKEMSK